MKAIDFACRLLARLAADDLSPASQQVLLAVAAGLDTSPDIARLTGLTQGSCTSILRHLARQKMLRRLRGDIYLLAPSGKERICRLFSFFGSRIPCERSDT